jgi:hypothetical protein
MRIPTRTLAIIAATTALILGGSTAAFALWSANGAVSSTATAATVSVSHALSGSTLTRTYTASDLIGIGVITVTNSSSRAGTYSVAISSTSSSASLRAAVGVVVGTAATCTTTSTITPVTNGTGNLGTTFTPTGSIAAGASIALCVRTSMTSTNVSANSNTSLVATAATTVAVGTWTATASPAITFTQSVGAPATTVDPNAWYWIRSTINTSLCAEGLNSGSSSGTAVVQGNCTAPNGSDASELFRFTATSGGFYRIVNKNAPTLAIGTTNPGNGRPVSLLSTTGDLVEWLPVFNSDSTVTFQLSNNTSRCLTIPGSSSTAGVQLESSNCATNSASQKFTLTMFNTATPVATPLTCSADGYNAYFSWPALTGYQAEVIYRVYIGGVLVSPHSRGTGWDPTVQLSYPTISTGTYGSGSKTVLVQQSVSSGPWSTVGTGTVVIAASVPYLACG